MKEFKLKHFKFLEFKILYIFKFLHPNILLMYLKKNGRVWQVQRRNKILKIYIRKYQTSKKKTIKLPSELMNEFQTIQLFKSHTQKPKKHRKSHDIRNKISSKHNNKVH